METDTPEKQTIAVTRRERAVLCFVVDGDQILLIHKKRGLGTGKINGPGGRIEPGETPEEAAIRETQEEVGVTPSNLRRGAFLDFTFTDGYHLLCDVFRADSWSGHLTETDEAAPFWCPVAKIPYDRMWADDPLWLPDLLADRPVCGVFVFDGDRMLSSHLEPLRSTEGY